MEFILLLVAIAGVAAILSAVMVIPIYRMDKPNAKRLAIVVGLILFPLIAMGGIAMVLIESARKGHPF